MNSIAPLYRMVVILSCLYFCILPLNVYSQLDTATYTRTIYYSGLDPLLKSPFKSGKYNTIGLPNPDRGFEVKGGMVDLFASGYDADTTDWAFLKAEHQGTVYRQNLVSPSTRHKSIFPYLRQSFTDDGITLVEIEENIHFTEDQLLSDASFPWMHVMYHNFLYNYLYRHGLKIHLIAKSDFHLFFNTASTINDPYDDAFDYMAPNVNDRIEGLSRMLELVGEEFYKPTQHAIANVHVGWLTMPSDKNAFRHSSSWMYANYNNNSWPDANRVYSLGSKKTIKAYLDYYTTKRDEHSAYRSSEQKFDWNISHSKADGFNYVNPFQAVRTIVIDSILSYFPHQKIIMKSLYPVSNYLGNTRQWLGGTGPHQEEIAAFYNGDAQNDTLYPEWQNAYQSSPLLQTADQSGKLRFGYYDGFFIGDSYSHAWGIGNGETQQIHWHADYKSNIPNLGVDWADNMLNVDAYLLRKYRQNIWVHGEMPPYEVTQHEVIDHAGTVSWGWPLSFHKKYGYYYNFYPGGYSSNTQTAYSPDHYAQYPFEIAERASDGRLQDGFQSALKMRYFNFTSFNVGHNYLLDNRSSYEMRDGKTGTISGLLAYPPNSLNTAISAWHEPDSSLGWRLSAFGMPIADKYFNKVRSPYEYIRDHLGYRIQLDSVRLEYNADSVILHIDLKNVGFAAPQNPRPVIAVIVGSNSTIQYADTIETDWRDWYPDDFDLSTLAYDNTSTFCNYGSPCSATDSNWQHGDVDDLEDKFVGGIPLGNFMSDWHHHPIVNKSERQYHLEAHLKLDNIDDFQNYHVGIAILDSYHHNDRYVRHNQSVRFGNQLRFTYGGYNILAKLKKGSAYSQDWDADGVPNDSDSDPYNPRQYKL